MGQEGGRFCLALPRLFVQEIALLTQKLESVNVLRPLLEGSNNYGGRG